jgi:ABC-type branched-subunit amino acid transport system substrate-binding protein
MKVRFLIASGACVLSFSIFSNVAAQKAPAPDSLFERATSAFRHEKYSEALALLDNLDRLYPNHERKTAALLVRGKTLNHLQRYGEALTVFRTLIQDHSASLYRDDALFGSAQVLYALEQYQDAVVDLFDVVETGKDRDLVKRAAVLTTEIMDSNMNDRLLEDLYDRVGTEKARAAVLVRLIPRQIETGQWQKARRMLGSYLEKFPQSPFGPKAREYMIQIEAGSRNAFRIGILLPLTGPLSGQAKAVLNGIQYAVDEHNAATGSSVELVIRDSKGRVLSAVLAVQEFCDDEEVIAVIGELESSVTAAVAGVLQERNMPLLAPTASEDGLTDIGSFIFQLNGNQRIRGEAMAGYAIDNLGLKSFAILAPADDYGKSMRDSFVEAMEKLGGNLLIEKWYFEGAADMGPQFKSIREAGLRKMVADSVLFFVSKDPYESHDPVRGTIYHVDQKMSKLADSTDFAVTTIDGIFIPSYAEDLTYVAPQSAFYNLGAKILGGTHWNDLDALEKNKAYLEGAVFLGEFYSDPSDYKNFQFRDKFRKTFGQTPGKMEIYGYDAVRLLISARGTVSSTRSEIRDRLADVKDFYGLRGRYQFDSHRVNPLTFILEYRNGQIVRIR